MEKVLYNKNHSIYSPYNSDSKLYSTTKVANEKK
jgi:hypothetical protein